MDRNVQPSPEVEHWLTGDLVYDSPWSEAGWTPVDPDRGDVQMLLDGAPMDS